MVAQSSAPPAADWTLSGRVAADWLALGVEAIPLAGAWVTAGEQEEASRLRARPTLAAGSDSLDRAILFSAKSKRERKKEKTSEAC